MQIQGYQETYQFEQPYFLKNTTFNNVKAVYVIYTVLNGRTVRLDVGETDKLSDRLAGHERKSCWEQKSRGSDIFVAVMQVVDEVQRRNIESDLRSGLVPLCGEK